MYLFVWHLNKCSIWKGLKFRKCCVHFYNQNRLILNFWFWWLIFMTVFFRPLISCLQVFFLFLFFELTVCIFTVMKIQIDIQILHRILLECMYTPSGTFCTMFTFFFILWASCAVLKLCIHTCTYPKHYCNTHVSFVCWYTCFNWDCVCCCTLFCPESVCILFNLYVCC